jgi:hypothetical protein
MTSPDGLIWTSRASATDNGWFGVTFGNGRFVAVAWSGDKRVMTSSSAAASTSTVSTTTKSTATSTVTTTTKSDSTTTATTTISTTTTTTTHTTTEITTTTTTTTTTRVVKCGSCSNRGTTVFPVVAVLAVLTFVLAVAVFVLVMRNRNLAAQNMHLQQGARGGNRYETVQTTSNPLHQGRPIVYEVPVVGQEAIYTQEKMEKDLAALEEPNEMRDFDAHAYVEFPTTATLA